MPYSKVKELPPALQAALASVGYRRQDVAVEVRERASRFASGGAGCRAFCAVVHLVTGQTKLERGSWGGANAFNPGNAVDLDAGTYLIPPNVAVINGSEGGGRPVCASITISPANAAALLPCADDELTDRAGWILYCFSALNSRGRADEFERRPRPSEAELDELAARGLLKRARNGATRITTAGRNALEAHRASHEAT
jgi:hypothetical protein